MIFKSVILADYFFEGTLIVNQLKHILNDIKCFQNSVNFQDVCIELWAGVFLADQE